MNFKNVLNLIAFAGNTAVTFGIGTLGWLDTPTNQELSEKYQTLITPNTTGFLIWPIIFGFQALFTIIQVRYILWNIYCDVRYSSASYIANDFVIIV